MKRRLFTSDHEMFRDSVRSFIEKELAPHHAQWEKDELVPRSAWAKAGEAGLLCCDVPEEYGGPGADWLYNIVVIEELARANITGPGFMVHSEMVAPYLLAWGSEELKRAWLPRMVAGEAIGAVAMTEPGGGSDLKNLKARAQHEGDDFIINGQKTYISNGQNCDFCILACRTADEPGAKGVSLILVPAELEGFEKGRNLEKIGYKAQDTSELFFADVRVPKGNLLGREGKGFAMLMEKLARERLTQAVRATAACEAIIGWTVDYVTQREMFGQTLADYQNTQFVLAQLEAETSALRIFTDWCITEYLAGELTAVDAAKAKLLTTDLHNKVANECLQFFGGYGYMTEYPVARAFVDARVTRIAGGATEVMKQIIARDLFSRRQ